MKESIVVIGGFSGARAAQTLAKAGFENVTLIDQKDYYEVTYATLRTLCQPPMGQGGRIKYTEFMECAFRLGEVVELAKTHVRLADGSVVPFDKVIIATGSRYMTLPVAKSNTAMTIEARHAEIITKHKELQAAERVLILGGGPVGVELAGEIADHFPDKSVTLAQGTDRLLDMFKPKAGRIAERQLTELGVDVRYDCRLTPDDLIYREADVVYSCVGPSPNTSLMRKNFPDQLDQAGRIQVDDQMRMVGSERIYAIGDCANAPGAKLGYLADKQAALVAGNLIASQKGKRPKRYAPPALMALIPIGRKAGLVQMPWFVTTFKPMVNLKQKDMFIGGLFSALGIKR